MEISNCFGGASCWAIDLTDKIQGKVMDPENPCRLPGMQLDLSYWDGFTQQLDQAEFPRKLLPWGGKMGNWTHGHIKVDWLIVGKERRKWDFGGFQGGKGGKNGERKIMRSHLQIPVGPPLANISVSQYGQIGNNINPETGAMNK